MEISITNEQDEVEVTPEIEALLKTAVARACVLTADLWSKSPRTPEERFFASVLLRMFSAAGDGGEDLADQDFAGGAEREDLAGQDSAGEVSILLVDDAAIRQLNRTHRGKDASTDVLSFPMIDPESDTMLPGPLMLGDIVISMPTAARQAREYGHTLQRELGFLTIHGMLHLLGCDHEEESERVRMRELEELILSDLRLTR